MLTLSLFDQGRLSAQAATPLPVVLGSTSAAVAGRLPAPAQNALWGATVALQVSAIQIRLTSLLYLHLGIIYSRLSLCSLV